MKSLIAVFTFVMIATAAAQSPELPTTHTFRDANGQVMGTATTWGNTMTMRDANGEITSTTTLEKDGTIIARDANGQITGSGKLQQ